MRSLVYLAGGRGEGFVSVETVAAAQEIPTKFLKQIMLALKRARFVRSQKGQRGGYSLAKSPGEISLAEVIRLFDGALAPTESVSRYFYETTPIEREAGLGRVLTEGRDWVSEKLENTTVADVC